MRVNSAWKSTPFVAGGRFGIFRTAAGDLFVTASVRHRVLISSNSFRKKESYVEGRGIAGRRDGKRDVGQGKEYLRHCSGHNAYTDLGNRVLYGIPLITT